MCIPWVGLDLEENVLNLKAFPFGICAKEAGAQRDEMDKCYVQITNLWPKIQVARRSSPLAGRISSASAVICFIYIIEKIDFQTMDCSKQIPDLLTAVHFSKGNH